MTYTPTQTFIIEAGIAAPSGDFVLPPTEASSAPYVPTNTFVIAPSQGVTNAFSLPLPVGYQRIIHYYRRVFSVLPLADVGSYDFEYCDDQPSTIELVGNDVNFYDDPGIFEFVGDSSYEFGQVIKTILVGTGVFDLVDDGIPYSYAVNEALDIGFLQFVLGNTYSYEQYIPPTWVSRQYIVRLGDLVLPVSSLNANLAVSGGSYLSVVVPDGGLLIDGIAARKTMPLTVNRAHVFSDGSIVEREFMRVDYDTISSAKGPTSGLTLTIVGRKKIVSASSKKVVANDVFLAQNTLGRRDYRLPIMDEIGLGDTVQVDGDEIVVGSISYYITPENEFMTIAEYISTTPDTNGIGSNAVLKDLQPYVVRYTDANYLLWQYLSFRYNRIPYLGENAHAQFNLYYDTNKKLWYLPGKDGVPNFAVYLSDGATQAEAVF